MMEIDAEVQHDRFSICSWLIGRVPSLLSRRRCWLIEAVVLPWLILCGVSGSIRNDAERHRLSSLCEVVSYSYMYVFKELIP